MPKISVIEGLDPEVIARAKESLTRRIPYGKGKIPAQMPDAVVFPNGIRIQNQLGIGRVLWYQQTAGFDFGDEFGAAVEASIGRDPHPVVQGSRLALRR